VRCMEYIKLTDVVLERRTDESLTALRARETRPSCRHALLQQRFTQQRTTLVFANELYKCIKLQPLLTSLLLLPSSERRFAARWRCDEQFVIDVRKLVGRNVNRQRAVNESLT